MRRFFVSVADIDGSSATLTGSEAHHLQHVLRLKVGSQITLFDGTGTTYEGEILALAPTVKVKITKVNHEDQNRPRLHLGQALIKPKKSELVVQKATELGVASITVFTSRYCAVKEPSADKQERWQRIAMESCKQCNRATPPQINRISSFKECITAAADNDLKMIFWEESADLDLNDIAEMIAKKPPATVFYIIGPEGGLTDKEVALAKKHGFLSVTLGKQILRAETATIAAGAVLQYLLGNMG
jgi:16S rRNA (uracil1498-N3)-methyltransferase